MTLFANLVIELKCQNVEHLPFGILETTQPYYERIWLFSHVQCHTEMLCNSRDMLGAQCGLF